MNVYKHELRVHLKHIILWTCVLCGISIIMMSFYTMIKTDMEHFFKLMENFPPALKAAMGIVTENFNSPIGFYGFVFTYTSLFAAIQAMNLGVSIVSKEERDKTADFLMTKPISRINILNAKLFSSLTIFLITNIIYSIITAIMINYYSKGAFENEKFILINLSLLLLQLILFSIGLIVSLFTKKIKVVLPVSLGIVFLFFALSAFAVTSEDAKLRFLTPFQYFKTDYIDRNGKYETEFVITGLIVFIVCIVLSYFKYKRKDVHAV